MPSPTSRSGTRIYLSLWDLFWAVVSPILALYLRDPELVFRIDPSVIGWYWRLSSGFALLAFFALRLQDGMTRYFSVHEALDIAEAVVFAELMTFVALFTLTQSRRHSTFDTAHSRVAAGSGTYSQPGWLCASCSATDIDRWTIIIARSASS